MNLSTLLAERREAILDAWLEFVLAAYAAEGARFFRSQQDPFANPVGQSLRRCTRGLLDGLVEGADSKDAAPWLEEWMRLRAVAGAPLSASVGAVLRLKEAVRLVLEGANAAGEITADDLWRFDCQVDELALAASDLFLKFREQIFTIRANEVKRSVFRLLARGNPRPAAAAGDEEDYETGGW